MIKLRNQEEGLIAGFSNPFPLESWISILAYIPSSISIHVQRDPMGLGRGEHFQQFLGPSLRLLPCCSLLSENKHFVFASEIWLGSVISSVCCLEMPCQGLHVDAE